MTDDQADVGDPAHIAAISISLNCETSTLEFALIRATMRE
jgi:hypothetical protein